jgi:hypothetical protein
MTATSVRWAVFAVIGLLVAVVVALLATHLVSEKIGIAAEPVSAGESLVPGRVDHRPRPGRRHSGRPTPTTATTSTAPAPAAGSSPGGSGESDDGAAKSKPTASGDNLSPAQDTSPPATPSPSGGSGTSTEPEPGDD